MKESLCCRKIRCNKDLDRYLIPADLNTKMLCKCPPPCIVEGIIEFAADMNRIHNMSTNSTGLSVNQPTQRFCPVCPKWRTKYECKTGCKLILSPQEVYNYWNYYNSPRAIFGAIMRMVLEKQWNVYVDHNLSYLSDGQYASSNTRFVCTKKCHPYSKKVLNPSHDSVKSCCHHKKGRCKCVKTNYF